MTNLFTTDFQNPQVDDQGRPHYEQINMTARAPTWEEISYPRPNTFGIKSVPNAITQDQLAILLHTLGLVNWVAKIKRVNNANASRLEISLKTMYNVDEFKRTLLVQMSK